MNPTVAWILISCVAQAHVIVNIAGCDEANVLRQPAFRFRGLRVDNNDRP